MHRRAAHCKTVELPKGEPSTDSRFCSAVSDPDGFQLISVADPSGRAGTGGLPSPPSFKLDQKILRMLSWNFIYNFFF